MPVLDITVVSRALRNNPLSDPHQRHLHVVVPDDHDSSRPIPCVWYLAGYAGVGRKLLAGDPWQEGLEARLRRLRGEGQIGPMAVALPDAFTALGGCQYLSSPVVGEYEQYLWQELPAALEGHVQVSRHGVAGVSSGGFGALVTGIRQPALVDAVACHSGDMGFEFSVLPDLPKLMNAVRDHGSVEALLTAHRTSSNRRDGRWFNSMPLLALAAVYSPSPQAPGGMDLPFELETGRLRKDVWERWLAFDPVRVVETSALAREALSRLKLLFIDCGRRDEHALHWGARQLSATLRDHGVAHEHEEFDGGHRNTSHRLDVSLPKLYQALS